jgi:lipopolysaccharide transport system permease protein
MLEVFIPDLRRFVPILLQIGFWVTPIVYTIDILPASMQAIQSGNPMLPALASVQRIVVYGQPPQPQALGILLAIVLAFGVAMMFLHHRTKKALRDAL